MFRVLTAGLLFVLAATVLAQKQDTAKRTRTIRVIERAGIAREQVPVETSVRVKRAVLKNASSLRLFRVESAGLAVSGILP